MYLKDFLLLLAMLLSLVGIVLFPDTTILGLEVGILSVIFVTIVIGGVFLKFFGMQLDYYRNFQLTKSERVQTLTFMGGLLIGLVSTLLVLADYILRLAG